MEELLRIPTEGIEDVIDVPAVLANEFELKIKLLDFISSNPFFGLDNDDPYSHIRIFYQITRTLKLNQVPHDVVKLILFLFSLKGAAETWLENKPPNSIITWDDLVSKFLNRFYPHSKTRKIRNEITNFQQVFVDQDSLNSAAGGNLMTRNTQEAFTAIENKAKVRTCRNKPQVSSSGGTSTQIDAITTLTKQVQALEYHIASMRETYDQNQEAAIQLMQNQMGQMAKALQESPLGVLPSNTVTDPRTELKAITTMDGLTLDGSFIPHYNFLVYQEKEQESETITKVVEIFSSQSTPLVPPPETPPLIDIIDTLCDKFPIQSNESSGRNTSHSLPDYEAFCFDADHQKEKSSGSTTSYFDHSLPDYEAFCFYIVHQEEKSSGSTTYQFDHSLPEYESFYFYLSIDPLPPAERSDSHHEKFTDKLAHIIYPPEYDYFFFDIKVDPGELTRLLIENSSSKNVNLTEIKEDDELKPKTSTKELTIHELNDLHLLLSN
ncbi:reverse transcriptase domain-containing protein [Tanacetum coccineum]|uniref:Reverse transcriptase domain-containing protein n=1 Tax=Tanacetum coccineum TaxID=301880 RepID=A0ABQ4WDZ0_9ASTR